MKRLLLLVALLSLITSTFAQVALTQFSIRPDHYSEFSEYQECVATLTISKNDETVKIKDYFLDNEYYFLVTSNDWFTDEFRFDSGKTIEGGSIWMVEVSTNDKWKLSAIPNGDIGMWRLANYDEGMIIIYLTNNK